MNRTHVAAVAILAIIPLAAACEDKNDASTVNFADAISDYLDVNGMQCLGTEQWPIDVKAGVFGVTDRMRMEALQSAGLVRSEPGDPAFANGEGKGVTRYSLTDDAEPFSHETMVKDGLSAPFPVVDLCWGKMGLHQISGWEGPFESDGFKKANVTFTYSISDVADWAMHPEVESAWPEIQKTIVGAGLRQVDKPVVLTADGWEVVETVR